MSSLPPVQPSTPANEWGSSTLNEMDERAKVESSSGALLNAVPGQTPVDTTTGTTLPPSTGAHPVVGTTAGALPPAPPMYNPTADATTLPATGAHSAILPTTTSPVPTTGAVPITGTIPSGGVLPITGTIPSGGVLPTTGAIPTTHAVPPVTHATISGTGTAPETYNPTVTSLDRFNEGGATATAPVAQTPGLDMPGSFPSSLAELQSTQAAQQAKAVLGVAQEKAAIGASIASDKAAAGASIAAEKAAAGASIAAEKASTGAQVAFAAAQEGFAHALSGAAQYLPQSLKEKAAPYLPEGTSVTANASHHDTVHATSYPSTEIRGAQPGETSGGVGALPGSALETGVAMPENLINPTPAPPTLTERLGAYVPDSVKQTAAPYLPAAATGATVSASEHDRTHPTSLPSNELTGPGVNEEVGGVGALPGAVTETGVAQPEALLDRPTGTVTQPTLAERAGAYVPDAVKAYVPAGLAASVLGAGAVASEHDRQHTASMPTAELTGAGTGERVGGAGALPGSVNETGVAVVPDDRVGEQTPTLAGRIANARNAALGGAAAAAAYVSHGTNQVRETVAPGSTVTTTAAAPHDTMSLPTTETEGIRAGESTGGVGALPGSVNETGIAVLPEEAALGADHIGTATSTSAPTTTGETHDHHRSTEAAVLGTAAAATGVAADRHHEHHREHEQPRSDVSAPAPVAFGSGNTPAPYAEPSGNLERSTRDNVQANEPEHHHRGAEAAALGTAAAVAGEEHHRHHETSEAAPTRHEYSDAPVGASTNDYSSPSKPHDREDQHRGLETAAIGSAAAVSEEAHDRHHDTPASVPAATGTPAATTATTAGTTDSTEHTGTKAEPQDVGGHDQSSYGDDYHPSQLHPANADYSGVELVDKPGQVHDKPTEGSLGASAATAGKTEGDNDVAGLKDGSDRKVHGGVPGDIGGGTMPVGDDHEGGTDSLDLKNKAGQHDRSSTTATSATDASDATSPTTGKPKFMDKLKGEMKILSGKIGHKPEKVEEGQRLKTGGALP